MAWVKIPEENYPLFRDGATMFDPMGNGRFMRDTVFLPESVMAVPDELRAWIQKALDFTASLPAKKKRPASNIEHDQSELVLSKSRMASRPDRARVTVTDGLPSSASSATRLLSISSTTKIRTGC
jgi:hypothetical protein